MLKNLIFDWSGTVSNDMMRTYEAAMCVFEHLGVKRISVEQFRLDFDIPQDILYRKHGIDRPLEEIDPLYDEYWEKSSSRPPNLYQSALEVLQHLRERFWLGILSSHPQEFLIKELKAHQLKDVFNHVEGNCRAKTKALEKILKIYSLEPMETLYIGDMRYDIISGKKAGIKTAGFGLGYQAPPVLQQEAPDYYFADWVDLQKQLLGN